MSKLKDGYYKQIDKTIGSNSYLLDSGGGIKSIDDFSPTDHTHDLVYATDKRDVKPNSTGISTSVKAIKPFFSSSSNLGISTSYGTYSDLLVMDTYHDSSGGRLTALAFPKATTSAELFVGSGAFNDAAWGTFNRVWTSGNSNNTSSDWSAKSLTLAGGISGATTIASSSSITAGTNLAVSNTSSTTGYGLSLYGGSSSTPPSYGMMFSGTATFGKHGGVTGDWATYLTMSGANTRGWIFKLGSTNVASINGTGDFSGSSFNGMTGLAGTGTATTVSRSDHSHSSYISSTMTDINQIHSKIGPDNTSSYLKSVVLLLPALKVTNWLGINHISGQFTFFKTGSNVYDTVDVIVTYVYNQLAYNLTSHGQNGEFKLAYCMYNGIKYLCLLMPYHANPYTNAYFRGIHKSTVDDKALGITYLSYYNENTKTPIIEEINNSLNTTLVEGVTTTVTNYKSIINNGVISSIGGFKGNLDGNSGTATKLATIRTINGTNFDGTANITTAYWGTARNLTIGNTAKPVNGSDHVSWTLGEIGAAAATHSHSINYITWGAGQNFTCSVPTANGQEWSIDLPDTSYTGNYWHVWTAKGGKASLLKVDNDSGVVSAPYGLTATRINIDSSGRIAPTNTAYRRAGMYGVYDSTKTGHIWSMGTSYMIPDDGSNFGNLYGLAYKHTNNTTGGTMAGGHQAVWCENGSPKAALGSLGVWAAGGFYKSGSSDSYVLLGGGGHKAISDFATSSHTHSYLPLSGGTLTGTLNGTMFIATNSGKNLEMSATSSYTKIQSRGGIPLSINPEGNNVGIGKTTASEMLEVGGNIKASVGIYDSARIGDRTFYNVATKVATASAENGIIKITMPYGFINSMGTYEIDIYEYNSRAHSKIYIGCYNYSGSSFPNCTVKIIGELSAEVRLAYDGTKCCILIGKTDTVWTYPQIYVTKVTEGHSYGADISKGWTISFLTSETGLSSITTPVNSKYLSSSNYTNYAPSKTGSGASGTWGISISGNSSTATRLGTSGTAATSTQLVLGNGTGKSTTSDETPSTVVERNSSGDINCRLVRSSYADQSTISGGLVYRVSTTDNYHRVCNSTSAIRTWLGVSASDHSHNQLTGVNYTSGGTEIPSFFGQGKMRYQMLGSGSEGDGSTKGGIPGEAWSDALWLSAYGADVPNAHVLLFGKGANHKIGFRKQLYNSSTWGRYVEIFHSDNANSRSIDWNCKDLNVYNSISFQKYGDGLGGYDTGFIRYDNEGAVDKSKMIFELSDDVNDWFEFRIWESYNTKYNTPLSIKYDGVSIPKLSINASSGQVDPLYLKGNATLDGYIKIGHLRVYESVTESASFGIDVGRTGNNDRTVVYNDSSTQASKHLFRIGQVDSLTITKSGCTSNAWLTYSDSKLKNKISPLESSLDLVSKLNPVRYNLINDGSKKLGFVAQELQNIYPEIVNCSGDYLSVEYNGLIPVLTKAIQELTAKVSELEYKLNLLNEIY